MTLEVACGATPSYLAPVTAMLHSLLQHTPRRPLRVSLMVEELPPPAQRAWIAGVVEAAGARCQFVVVDAARLAGFPNTPAFHRSVWHRVLLPELLPDADKVLYLDADLIVTGDLGPLWDTDLGGHVIAGVVAPFYPGQSGAWLRAIGVPQADYISSGVLLMDLARMRQEGSVAQLRAFAAAHPANPCPEQDALNALFHARCLRLHPRWNAQPAFFELPPARLGPHGAEAAAAPAVVHFAGPAKPWHYLSRHPLRHLYFEHLRQTPWPVPPLEGRTWRNRLLRLVPRRWQFVAFRMVASFAR